MIGLTPLQAKLLDFIRRYQRDGGASPSFDEMVTACCIPSKSTIHRLLTALEERGAITSRTLGRYRSITVTDETPCLSALRAMDDASWAELLLRIDVVKFERSRAAAVTRFGPAEASGLEHVSKPLSRALKALAPEGSR